MNLNDRKDLLIRLGAYMTSNDESLQQVKHKAFLENNWFTTEFVNLALYNIAQNFLQLQQLDNLIAKYNIPQTMDSPKRVGIVMAGNIPLVGFHDFLCVFLGGHIAVIKPSSKDETLVKHFINKLIEWNSQVQEVVLVQFLLKGCDAYIATGSNNSGRYFEHYFKNYASIIRKNRTSVALLTGEESKEDLERLADDVHQYFGLGCRNVTKLYVPEGYDFIPLLDAFKKYAYLNNHNKYKNNYDYQLAAHILNNRFYMTSGSILLVEGQSIFSPIAQLHYEFYKDLNEVREKLSDEESVQCIVGKSETYFGEAQCPQICDYADGVDTMKFLMELAK
jgi:Acyl-CoA reductase (LuxC)